MGGRGSHSGRSRGRPRRGPTFGAGAGIAGGGGGGSVGGGSGEGIEESSSSRIIQGQPGTNPNGSATDIRRNTDQTVGTSGASTSTRSGRGQLPEWEDNETALRQIIIDTGMSYAEARRAQDVMVRFFGDDYESFTKGVLPEESAIISEAVMRMPYYNGDIWRGIELDSDVATSVFLSRWLPGTTQSFSDKLGNNTPIVTSFSSAEDVGRNYARWNYTNPGYTSIVFHVKNNHTAAAVQHISSHGAIEEEVMAPTSQRFRVLAVINEGQSRKGGFMYTIELEDMGRH